MYLEIVSPEKVLLSAEVNSVTVPGVEGEFPLGVIPPKISTTI